MRNANHIVHRKAVLLQLHQAVLFCCLQILRRFLINYPYDDAGNMTYAGNQNIAYNFTYDANNRITRITDSNNLVIDYTYDAAGNRGGTGTLWRDRDAVHFLTSS